MMGEGGFLPSWYRIVEELNRVRNKVCFGNLGISKDVVVPFHDELLCLLELTFVYLSTLPWCLFFS